MGVIKNFQQFVFIFLMWALTGYVNQIAAMVLVVLTFLYLIAQSNFKLIVVCFLTLLVFSDSRQLFMQFAITIKPAIAVLLGIISYLLSSKKWSKNTVLQFYVPYLVLVVVTMLFDFDMKNLLKSLSMFLILFNTPILTYYVLKKDKEGFLKLFFYAIAFIFFVGLVLRFSFPLFVTLEGRYTGVLGNPNGLGIFITVYYFLFQVTLYYFPKLFAMRIKLIIYFMLFASLYLSQSRNAMLNIGVFHVFMFLNKRSVVLSFIVLGVIVSSYGFLLSSAIKIIQLLGLGEYARVETIESGSGRTIAWEFIWEKIKNENFWFGTGIGATETVFRDNYDMLSRMGHQGNAHNSYLTIWYDLGIFGLISFAFAYIANMLRTIKNYIAFPIIVGLMLSANFESWFSASLNPFHIGALMIITFLHFISDEKINERREKEIEKEKQLKLEARKAKR